MRVLHVNAGNLYGGIETLLVTLAQHRAVCPEMEPEFALCFEGKLSDELRAAGVRVHVLGPARMSRPWTLWRVRRRLRSLLAAGEYDLVVTHGCWPHAIAAPECRRACLPFVFWMHNFLSGRHWLEKWAGRHRPNFLLANSQATLATAATAFPNVPTDVLHYPVSAPHLPDRSGARREIRAALDTPEHAVVLVTACRLEAWKGHRLLLDALAHLHRISGWHCWIAGGAQRPSEQRYLRQLEERVAILGLSGRVQFLGERSDVARVLAAADLHCQPNTGAEPFGIAFVEALHAGLPVVTTALGGALEIIDETCGILVPPGDGIRLGAALQDLVQDPQRRRHLSSGGPARATLLCHQVRQLRKLGRVLSTVCMPEPATASAS